MTSLVAFLTISTSTGPGRPVLAISNALLSVGARSFTSFTIKLVFVADVVMHFYIYLPEKILSRVEFLHYM